MFTILVLNIYTLVYLPSAICFGMGGAGGSYGGGAFGQGAGGMGYLPVGYTMLDGELVDMSNKLLQRLGGSGGGTQYFSWTDQRGPPVFRRREIDSGRRFIVFPDRNYPPGDGHYVVLRRFQHGRNVRRGGNIYEAFYLDLGDSINAMVTNFNSLAPASTGLLGGSMGGSMGGRRILQAGGMRMKRHVQFHKFENPQIAEMVYLRKLTDFEPRLIVESSSNEERLTASMSTSTLHPKQPLA